MDESDLTMTSPLLQTAGVEEDANTIMTDDLSYSDESKTLKYRNRTVMLYLSSTHVLIHDVKTMKKNIELDLNDIIGCEATQNRKKTVFYLKLYAFPTKSGCCSGGPKRVPRTYCVVFDDRITVLNWVNAVNCSIRHIPLSYIGAPSAETTCHQVRPPPRRKFICVVNPFSGKGTALKIWQRVTEPMLKLADVEVVLLVTERANHAYEYMTKCNLDDIDLVLTVGGDGILFEVINGLYSRDDVRNAIEPVPVFPIPGGTGNGLTKSILHESGEDFSPQNATFVALKGSIVPMDLSYVETKNHKHYAFLILGWGLISDVDILSESMRWMGEPRMTVAALYFLLVRRLYRGKLSMFTGVRDDKSSIVTGPGCAFNSATTADENAVLPPLCLPIPSVDGWTVVEADFVTVWVLQTSHCSVNVHSGPGITLDDGLFTIIVVRDISRFDMIKLLLGIEDGSHVDHPNVEIYKASAYRLEPMTERGLFSLDGEVVEYGPIQASILPSIARTVSLKSAGMSK